MKLIATLDGLSSPEPPRRLQSNGSPWSEHRPSSIDQQLYMNSYGTWKPQSACVSGLACNFGPLLAVDEAPTALRNCEGVPLAKDQMLKTRAPRDWPLPRQPFAIPPTCSHG